MRFNTDQARFGIAQGFATKFLQDEQGQLQPTHSISAGLDYVGVSPILADLEEQGKVRMTQARDTEVMQAFQQLASNEGIIAALESSHAIAAGLREAAEMDPSQKSLSTFPAGVTKTFLTSPKPCRTNLSMILSSLI